MDTMESVVGDLDTWHMVRNPYMVGSPHTWWLGQLWWGARLGGQGWAPHHMWFPHHVWVPHHVSGIQVSRSPAMDSMVSMGSISLFRLID